MGVIFAVLELKASKLNPILLRIDASECPQNKFPSQTLCGTSDSQRIGMNRGTNKICLL